MGKFFLFYFLWRITGNPILSLLVLFALFYFLDRRYVGLFPSITKPWKRSQRIRKLTNELRLNPHHTGNKHELAQIFIDKRQFHRALPYIQDVHGKVPDSPEIIYELGLCLLKTGNVEKGEQLILLALQEQPNLKYGEPYLELLESLGKRHIEKSLHYVDILRKIHFSSVETYYRLGGLLLSMGRGPEARSAYLEAIGIYKSLPAFLRRKQRKWAILTRIRLILTSYYQ